MKSSGLPRGVSLCSHGYGYTARCRGKHLGHFSNPESASLVYEKALALTLGVEESEVSLLTRTGGKRPVFSVDEQFAGEVAKRSWCYGSKGYVQTSPVRGGKPLKLHNFVWELSGQAVPDGLTLDHRNRDKTDCRLCNLRLATPRMQALNRVMPNGKLSVGVTFVAANSRRPYRVYVGSTYVGLYVTEEEAAAAYETAREGIMTQEMQLIANIVKEGDA